MYIGAELLTPKAKWYIVIVFIILGVIFNIVIFLDPLNSFMFNPPDNPGESLIDYNINLFTLAGMLLAGLILPVLVFLGIGFIIKARQSTGIIKKKFYLISVGAICFCIFGLLEGNIQPGILLIFIRLGFISSFWFMYYGLKT